MTSATPYDTGHQRSKDLVVLYVMGYGRSGSTIIGNVLGEIPGFVHLGELRSLWRLGLLGGRVCGCGSPVKHCSFWERILTEAFGSKRPAPSEVVHWQRQAVRLRSTLRLLRLQLGEPSGSPALEQFEQTALRIYRAAASITGSQVVIDTSKHIPEAALLHLLPGIKPYFIHLVRDPRAVAFSWQRSMYSPGEGRKSEMPRHGSVTSSRGWALANIGAEIVRHRSQPGRSIMIRYEDFVAEPHATINRILGMLGLEPVTAPFLDPVTVELHPNHTAGGNPSRLTTGQVSIQVDDHWKSLQTRAARLVTTGITFPLIRRYRYPLRARKH